MHNNCNVFFSRQDRDVPAPPDVQETYEDEVLTKGTQLHTKVTQ